MVDATNTSKGIAGTRFSATASQCMQLLHAYLCFTWNRLNTAERSVGSLEIPHTRARLGGRSGGRGKSTGRHHMEDGFVWIRVVTPEWEYTERMGPA